MRSIVVKDSSIRECGICHEKDLWIEERSELGVCFLYCRKCNTITFDEDIDYQLQNKIENKIKKEMYQNKKHD